MNTSPEAPERTTAGSSGAHEALAGVVRLLELEKIEENIFRGQSAPIVGEKFVFGGQVVAQALRAAARTVPESRPPHSLHAYFILPGDPAVPIVYDVDRLRDGGSFTTRRVVAIQKGEAIFNLSASFQQEEEGFDHQVRMPDVPPPEELQSERQLRREAFERLSQTDGAVPEKTLRALERSVEQHWPIEFRPIDPVDPLAPEERPPRRCVWLPAAGPLPDDPALHRALLAFASDFGLMQAAMRPHGLAFLQPDFLAASLDHALWLHRSFRLDEWLLYAADGPSASGGRGLNRGQLFTRAGHFVASVVQEGLMRRRR